MARCPDASWNPAPESCYTARRFPKLAVCLHRMEGYARYMREFQHLQEKPPRRISAHLTIGMDGSLEQHVDSEHVAWTQGIRERHYSDVTWPLFLDRNPNLDLLSIELEDGARNWSAERPMPQVQMDTLRVALTWAFAVVVSGPLAVNTTIIGHFHIKPSTKINCPGRWWWSNQMAEAIPTEADVRRYRDDYTHTRLNALEQRVLALEGHRHEIGVAR